MQRKGSGRIFGRKKPPGKGKQSDKDQDPVHRRNFRWAALPVIFLFNLLRFLAFQLWIVLTFVCRSGAHALDVKTININKQKSAADNLESGGQQQSLTTPLVHTPLHEMASARVPSVGPGEPALAKQKHHHRKAFECISKALKIDEEDRGWFGQID